MRNKWYVAAILLPAAALIWGAVKIVMRDGGLYALLPAGLAAALIWAAVRVARSESFAPNRQVVRWEQIGSPALEKWKAHHADEQETAARNSDGAKVPASGTAPAPRGTGNS